MPADPGRRGTADCIVFLSRARSRPAARPVCPHNFRPQAVPTGSLCLRSFLPAVRRAPAPCFSCSPVVRKALFACVEAPAPLTAPDRTGAVPCASKTRPPH